MNILPRIDSKQTKLIRGIKDSSKNIQLFENHYKEL